MVEIEYTSIDQWAEWTNHLTKSPALYIWILCFTPSIQWYYSFVYLEIVNSLYSIVCFILFLLFTVMTNLPMWTQAHSWRSHNLGDIFNDDFMGLWSYYYIFVVGSSNILSFLIWIATDIVLKILVIKPIISNIADSSTYGSWFMFYYVFC